MRIAILGAPGSGKHALMDALRETDELKDHTFVPSPIGELAEQKRGMGPRATYAEHFLLYGLQQRALETTGDPDNVVQSGTVIQRLAHLCTNFDEIRLGDTQPQSEPEVLSRLIPGIEVMTNLTMDTYRTDLTFLLLRDVPADISGHLSYDDKVQFHIQDVLDKLQISHRILAGDVEEKAQDILEAVNERASESVGSGGREDAGPDQQADS